MKQTIDSKYVQQHLANERTFLAWIRTVMTIMGVGLVITSAHFQFGRDISHNADTLMKIIGYSSLVLGVLSLIFCSWSYLQKRQGINNEAFRASAPLVIFLSASLVLVAVLFALYLSTAF